jgi:hypothetical protein
MVTTASRRSLARTGELKADGKNMEISFAHHFFLVSPSASTLLRLHGE